MSRLKLLLLRHSLARRSHSGSSGRRLARASSSSPSGGHANPGPSPGTDGLNTAWSWRGVLLRTSHLVHPALGLTHRWSLTLGRPGPDPAAPSWS